ncbi:SLAC1 anion channel family protein [Desulfurispira natronophila]|uniref:Tellurite resistance protein n=1 Tax=Desulfurispira natronophila TaxID=682562 RepID=A0A7W7Y2L7_9BACT|nr:SLAC1 anion channel family protein [Desulfurispira natronophila]MBB5020784.1 tellurite resistance protein [Desulfurispira natronophila]
MSEPASTTNEHHLCLQNLPIPLFGSVMGLSGLALATIRIEEVSGYAFHIGQGILHLTLLWFVVLLCSYLLKWLRYPADVAIEYHHPVRMNFFPAISISLLLLSIGYLNIQETLSAWFWYAGSALHFFFVLRILRVWFFSELQLKTLNPAWFIPVVGTILVPVAGTTHAPMPISWFFFSIGIVFWIALLSIVLNRVIFHETLPLKLLPTLFILVAPPAVGFIAYIHLTGELNAFAQVLYFNGLFMTILVLSFGDRFVRLPFFVSWWAYTFPLAAACMSTLLYYELSNYTLLLFVASGILVLLFLVIAVVGFLTIRSAFKGELCVPE